MEHILTHSTSNPRNSEGAFAKLADGTLYFAYSRYNGTSDHDNASADIAAVISRDNGQSWSEPFIVLKNTQMNLMSVSLLRLQDGRIAMVYLEKSAIPGKPGYVDCRPKIIFSTDETKSWSAPVDIADVPAAYFVVNNDRMIQMKNGRLIIPAAQHLFRTGESTGPGVVVFFISDDSGASWRMNRHFIYPVPQMPGAGFMEPGVIELNNSVLQCFIRTAAGCQYKSFSYDQGETWTPAIPDADFICPQSPLSMKRDPESGKLYAVWNDYNARRAVRIATHKWERTPLVMAESSDDGHTWQNHRILEDAPDHGYCYIAMFFNGDQLHLGYCCGGEPACTESLQETKLRVLQLRCSL